MSKSPRQNRHAAFTFLSILLLSACTQKPQGPDFSQYRDAVRNELRDPDSAAFRNEKVRTLWAAGGKRVVIYCAELNANNAFGGKTGFRPVWIHISSKGIPESLIPVRARGKVLIQDKIDINYYLGCIRQDTQRKDESIGGVIFDMSTFNSDKIDAEFPAISNEVAPELR